jgi:tetratricopeptide (TPR) repeat protein
VDPVNTFYGHLTPEIRVERRKKFLSSIADSLTVLCPRGTGENTYRFFETMSMGRIPVLIADTCALPFEDDIDYDSFMLRIPESEVVKAGTIIAEWLSRHSTEELLNKCKRSRQIWEQYFKCSEWNQQIIKILSFYKQKGAPIHTKTTGLDSLLHIEPVPNSGGMIEVKGVKGFLVEGDIRFLFEKAKNLPRDGTIIEIGSFMGLSSIIMANALFTSQNYAAKLYCIDTWEGSPEHADLSEIKTRQLFDIFLANIQNSGVGSLIHPIRKPSVIAAADFTNESVDMIYVDGDHSFEGCYADLKAWYPKLRKEGILFGHDCTPDGGVRQALEKFANEHGFTYKIFDYPLTHYMFEIHQSDSPEALTEQALSKLHSGDRGNAKNILLDLIRRWPKYAPAYQNLAAMSLESGDFETASKYFEEALKLDKNNRETVFAHGNMLMSNKKYVKAKEVFEKYLTKSVDDSEMRSLLQKCEGILRKVSKLGQMAGKIK